MSNAIVVLLMLAAAPPAFAGQSLPAPGATTRFGSLRPAQAPQPYRKLFEPQRHLTAPDASAPAALTLPKVVCGMTIVPADPKFDPKMLLVPKSDGIDYQIRAIDPPICQLTR